MSGQCADEALASARARLAHAIEKWAPDLEPGNRERVQQRLLQAIAMAAFRFSMATDDRFGAEKLKARIAACDRLSEELLDMVAFVPPFGRLNAPSTSAEDIAGNRTQWEADRQEDWDSLHRMTETLRRIAGYHRQALNATMPTAARPTDLLIAELVSIAQILDQPIAATAAAPFLQFARAVFELAASLPGSTFRAISTDHLQRKIKSHQTKILIVKTES